MKHPMVDKLKWYIDAGFPILYIQTFEEGKADGIIADAAGKKKVYEWNGSDGLVDFKTKAALVTGLSLEDALTQLKAGKDLDHRLLVIKDVSERMKPDRQLGAQELQKVVALLKDIARKIRNQDIDSTVIIISPTVNIPKDLEKLITVFKLELPKEEEIRTIIKEFAKANDQPAVYPGLLDEMAVAFKGLSNLEIEDLLALAIGQDGELNRKALQLIFEQKKQMILKAGVLELVPVKESIDDIGGLEILKEWLQRKAAVFKDITSAAEFGVPMPKGVMIAGVPGCGKSLTAKAASSLLEVPLLKLDMGRLMGKYVGESEENMRRAIELAEAMSPCVLWVDELEKAFAGISGGGSEVTTRLFGTFLTWMQEKTCAAFVIATANDISHLPPELMRKGRFDEIFYVSLPSQQEREKIFEIHLTKRRKADVENIDIGKLVSKTEGYSGADIESVVGESVESAFVKKMPQLTTEEIMNCIASTHSLKEIMEDQINQLSKLYEERKFKKASR